MESLCRQTYVVDDSTLLSPHSIDVACKLNLSFHYRAYLEISGLRRAGIHLNIMVPA
jgi:hypothetical protein